MERMAEPVPFFNPQEGGELWRILEKKGDRELTIPNMIIILPFLFLTNSKVRWSSRLLIFVISLYFSIIFLSKNHFSKWHFCFKEVRDQSLKI